MISKDSCGLTDEGEGLVKELINVAQNIVTAQLLSLNIKCHKYFEVVQ